MKNFSKLCLISSVILSTAADIPSKDRWIAVPWQPSVSYDYYHEDPKSEPEHYHEGYIFRTVPYLNKPQPAIGSSIVPEDVMVDVINDLGINLLSIHNEHNENNIALSPYGAISVLAALSEGLNGEAVHEILYAAHLPKDRHIVRVGLRDIHRHLKSYFIPPEGFLAGLTLNLSNVTLRTEYEDVLRFYGFDYGSFNNALYPEPLTTQKPLGTTAMLKGSTDISSRTTQLGSRIGGRTESSAPEETISVVTTTENTEITTINSIATTSARGETTALAEITETPTSVTETPSSTTISNVQQTTTQAITTTINKPDDTTVTATEVPTTTVTAQELQTTQAPTTIEQTEVSLTTEITTSAKTTEEQTTSLETLKALETAPETTVSPPSTTTVPSTFTTQMSTMFPESTTSVPEGSTSNFENEFDMLKETTGPPQFFDDSQTTSPFFIGSTSEIPTSTALLSENQPNFDYYGNYQDVNADLEPNAPNYEDINPSELVNDITSPPNFPEAPPNAEFSNNLGKRNVRSVQEYVQTGYLANLHRHQNRQYLPEDTKTFSIYGKYREPGINYMKYDTVLPFSYLPNLNALALRFPLDSSRYYLLLLLPIEENGVDQLVCDLRLHGGLKYIVGRLRLTHVVATIPSFMLKGYVSLTPTLQKLGIRDVFEPRKADFSPMTDEKNIYVTNIEQAVTVTIRNYLDPSAEHYKNYEQYDPVYFTADHPFLYFVLDSELNVALMVGKVVNPLNSRIR